MKVFFLSLAVLLVACQASPNAGTEPQNSETPAPGSGSFRNDCTNFTQDLDQDLKIANPEGKEFLSKDDLGVGSDSYLGMRFQKADQNQDQQLNQEELRMYLSEQPDLGEICRKP